MIAIRDGFIRNKNGKWRNLNDIEYLYVRDSYIWCMLIDSDAVKPFVFAEFDSDEEAQYQLDHVFGL